MKNKFIINLPIYIIGLLIIGYMIYFYPVQKVLAENSFSQYIALQGINEENILSKRVFKDYKQDGYCIDVVYKDDSNLRYNYKYYTGNNHESTFNMICAVYNDHNVSIEVSRENAKYPPLTIFILEK